VATVAKKLGIQSGMIVGVDGLDIAAATRLFEDVPPDVQVRKRAGTEVDQLILAADGLTSLDRMLPRAWDEVKSGGRLWVWYRKGAGRAKPGSAEAPLHRDTLQAALAGFGLVGVTLISVDGEWSSMRVRPA
jgi:hypothetical protein